MFSIIIPCYNTGQFLIEAINSVLVLDIDGLEIVVVNDGSTDEFTLSVLNSIHNPIITIIHQENKGLSAARNIGVKFSSNKFIFFLDSDNRVKLGYFEKALKAFNENSDVGVVYSRPFFFGESNIPRFNSQKFNFDALLARNFIDACAFVRRDAFNEIGGFDENRGLYISEDWEFWIRLALTTWKFHFLDEQLFDYRIRKDSMIGEGNEEKIKMALRYIGNKHGFIFHNSYRRYYKFIKKIEERPFTLFLKVLYYKYILKRSIMD